MNPTQVVFDIGGVLVDWQPHLAWAHAFESAEVHPRLGIAFDTLVVSGQEIIAKPDPKIFGLLCDRAGGAPQSCVFFDDGLNISAGARAVGMDAIHFADAATLRIALKERGFL